MRLRKGDTVRVISGKFKGSEGKIMAVFPDTNRVIVENVNVIKKAQRPSQEKPRGGFVEREAAIHASKVQILDPQSGKLTRVAHKLEDSRKVRVSAKSGARLDS
jgi:large subunit ribosomal protein L24